MISAKGGEPAEPRADHRPSAAPKVQKMVDRADDFDVILAAGNLEALILESNLIKLHRPYYNIKLMDDKLPYIRVMCGTPRLTVACWWRRTAQYWPLLRHLGHRWYGASSGDLPLHLRTEAAALAAGPPCINHEIGQCLSCAGLVPRKPTRPGGGVMAFPCGPLAAGGERLEMTQASRDLQSERAGTRDSIGT